MVVIEYMTFDRTSGPETYYQDLLGDQTEKATTMGAEIPPLRTQQKFIIVLPKL
jgi:hypothetical protein